MLKIIYPNSHIVTDLLEKGALLVIDEDKQRIRILPLTSRI